MSPQPLSHRPVRDAIEVCRRELGTSRSLELLAVAALEATQYAIEDPAVGDDVSESEAAYRVWWAIWQLALCKPAAFSINPAELGNSGSVELAFLHARKRYPSTIPELTLTRAQRAACQRARQRLVARTGLPAFARPGRIWVIGRDCLPLRAHTSLRPHAGIAALSLGHEPKLADESVIDAGALRAIDEGLVGNQLPDTVIHEQAHNVLNATVAVPFISTPLLRGLNECAVTLCELATHCERRDDRDPDRAVLRSEITAHPYEPPLRRLLRLSDRSADATQLLQPLIAVTIDCHRAAGDDAIAAALNETFDRDPAGATSTRRRPAMAGGKRPNNAGGYQPPRPPKPPKSVVVGKHRAQAVARS